MDSSKTKLASTLPRLEFWRQLPCLKNIIYGEISNTAPQINELCIHPGPIQSLVNNTAGISLWQKMYSLFKLRWGPVWKSWDKTTAYLLPQPHKARIHLRMEIQTFEWQVQVHCKLFVIMKIWADEKFANNIRPQKRSIHCLWFLVRKKTCHCERRCQMYY